LLPEEVPVELNVLGSEPGLVLSILIILKSGNEARTDLRRRVDRQIKLNVLVSEQAGGRVKLPRQGPERSLQMSQNT
jgi:hypothetical protein